ncbi:cytochrome P450 [Streptomyces sp. WM6373]|uniref:cytochrome n=1 Tax=Streptomyces sp. WM6373 TaxID=1415556 RepID=UPI0006AE4DF8|nr:cytochrome [Streptomyces sp. WM6373]KOU33080.1 cytochrome P450 [Streptomyces sp. WM6373]
MNPTSHARARRRDRRVYLGGHPVLFGLLAATRGRPVRRIGGTLLVHGTEAYREALTRLPLDRTAEGTTGSAARTALGGDGGVLFDQEGGGHRADRRDLAGGLGAAGVEELRARWQPLLARRLAPLAEGAEVDLVELARELSGTVVCALLGSGADPCAVARAAAEAAAASVRSHLPGPRRPRAEAAAARAAGRLRELLGRGHEPAPTARGGRQAFLPGPAEQAVRIGHAAGGADGALAAMVAVAAVNTTVAALPRAVAWCADAGLWDQAADETLRAALAAELLRVTAASPLLPRAAAADGTVGGCPVRAGDRLLLVARHAAHAHRRDPDARRPAEPALSRLVFGAGTHACPGARLASVQLADVLAALAPFRPVVTRARVDRGAALPGWRTLCVRAAP